MTYAFSSLKKQNINTHTFLIYYFFLIIILWDKCRLCIVILSVRVVKLLKHGRLITELGSLYLHVIKLHTLAGRY